jgi:hypothetical protein
MHPDSNFFWLDWAQSHIQEAAAADSFRTLDYGYSLDDFNAGFTQAVDNHTPIGIKPFLQNRFEATESQLEILGVNFSQKSGSMHPYPNPFRNHVFLPVPESGFAKLRLMDFSGREIAVDYKEAGSKKLHLNLESLPKGLYRLTLDSNQGELKSFTISAE